MTTMFRYPLTLGAVLLLVAPGAARAQGTAVGTLSQEVAAAKAAGLPTTAKALQAPLPPDDQNAAVIYRQLGSLLRDKPLNPGEENAVAMLAQRRMPNDDEISRARQILAERRDVLDLVHSAAARPRCVFQRDWSAGIQVIFPEFATMRSAARWLDAESFLQAKDGKPAGAVRTQGLGFAIARHATSDPALIAHLVSIAIDALTLAGMEHIVALQSAEPSVYAAVSETVAHGCQVPSFRAGLRGEIGMQLLTFAALRTDGFSALGDDAVKALPDSIRMISTSSPEWTHFVDSSAAFDIHEMRRLVEIADGPVARVQEFAAGMKASYAAHRVAAHAIAVEVVPVLAGAADRRVRLEARQRIVIAAAAVAAWRIAHGTYPRSLAEALPSPPADPFGAGSLGYRREASGFVVYSVGTTGNYRGGAPGEPIPTTEDAFRIGS